MSTATEITRAEAYQAASGDSYRAIILAVLVSHPAGMTVDEIERYLGLRHQTASARVHELMRQGRIVERGEKRATSSGRRAVVWHVAEGVA